jgi:hypothetical protein
MQVFEEYITEEQRSAARFLCAKELKSKDIHKEMFPVGRKCLSRKAVHNWEADVPLMTKRFKRRYESG